jgi:hypothetical protein
MKKLGGLAQRPPIGYHIVQEDYVPSILINREMAGEALGNPEYTSWDIAAHFGPINSTSGGRI